MRPVADPGSLSNSDLVRELFSGVTQLAKRQLKLAELEGKQQLRRGLRSAGWFGAGGGLAYAGLLLVLVAAGLGIGVALGKNFWAGALIAAACVFVLAALFALAGWLKRVKRPMRRSRRELDREIAWAKNRATT